MLLVVTLALIGQVALKRRQPVSDCVKPLASSSLQQSPAAVPVQAVVMYVCMMYWLDVQRLPAVLDSAVLQSPGEWCEQMLCS